jgi:hypothetical protein
VEPGFCQASGKQQENASFFFLLFFQFIHLVQPFGLFLALCLFAACLLVRLSRPSDVLLMAATSDFSFSRGAL